MKVLLELVITIVARPSAALRTLAKQAVRAFASAITPGSLQILLDVLPSSSADLFDRFVP
jgi:hypothetical protein